MEQKKTFLKNSLIIILVFLNLFFISCVGEPKLVTDIDKYLPPKEYIDSPLMIFPSRDQIEGKAQDFFWYGHNNYWVNHVYVIFLKVKYEESEREQEIERIKSLVFGYDSSTIKGVEVDEDCVLFNYPTYVATYWSDIHFEYVSFDFEKNEIIYVFTDSPTYAKDVIDNKYLPKEVVLGEDWGYHHDMYAFCSEKWIGDEDYHY